MKRIFFLLFFIPVFAKAQLYQSIPQRSEFKDSVKLDKNKNNAAGDSILSTDINGRIINVIKPAGTGGGGSTDTTSLSNRIDARVKYSDTSTMLSPYINSVGFGLIKTGQQAKVDSNAIKALSGWGGTTPTWQQTLTAGDILTRNNTIDGGGHLFTWNDANGFLINSTNDIALTNNTGTASSQLGLGDGVAGIYVSNTGGHSSEIRLYIDSLVLKPEESNLYIDTLNSSSNATDSMMVWDKATGRVGIRTIPTGGGTTYTGTLPVTVTGSVISMPKASATDSGWISIGTQTFAGIKTFPTPIFTTSAETPLLLGATTSGANLTLQSTSHATKGKILFGTSAYDEVNNRLGIQQATPTSKLQINTDANSVTQSDANGILLANATAATVGLQSISPPIVMQGNGWKTTATAGSQDVRFKMDVLPVQGSTNPTATWQLSKSINGAAYTTPLLVASTGDVTVSNTVGSFIFSAGTQVQAIGGSTGGASAIVYRTTDAGANVTPRFTSGASSVTAGVITTNIDPTNGFTIAAANGTRQIARAGINITNLVNTAASESADLIFLTQSAGGAMTEKVRILSTGETGIGVTPTSALHTTSFATAYTGSAVDIALTAVHQVVALTVTGKTATLPTAVGISGRIYTIKLTASGTGTVATTSSQTIDGSTTYSLASQYKYVTVQSNNANWNVIGNN